MSAFIVADAHIDALISYAVQRGLDYYNPAAKTRVDVTKSNAEELGRMLLDQNVRSVGYRYSGRIDNEEKNAAADYTFKPWPLTQPLSAVQIIKACDCFDYQACETDDYEGTAAWRLIQAIRAAASTALPGYNDAAWGIDSRPADDGAILLSSLAKR